MTGMLSIERLPIRGADGTSDKPSMFARARIKPKVESFDYDAVSLLASRTRDQLESAWRVYGAIPNDDILKGFRRAAGLPAPGNDMGGWCAETSGVIFGQLVSGMARLGAAIGDRTLIAKVHALVAGWGETLGADGDARMRLYDWDKLVCGLVDAHRYAGVDTALPLLERTLGWAEASFDRTRMLADNYDFWGGGPARMSEWYTLPENLYRAYLLSGNERFREFASVWLYQDYWKQFERGPDIERVVAVHAYSHVNSFSSAALAYAVTGEERYLRICVNAYDFLQRTQVYATGGFGPDERLMPPDGALGRSLELYAGHAEIPCGSWAAFKLSRYLIGFTGEARYGDWIETLLYNGIGAALPTEPDGRTFYYGDYRISSGINQYYWHAWPCCSGTYLQAVADYHNVIYFKDGDGLYVNLFVPSRVFWTPPGGAPVLLRQETSYPEAETSTLRLEIERPLRFKLRVRIPGWCHGASITVNATPLAIDTRPGHWAVIDREWQPGDAVLVTLPMALRLAPIDPQHPNRAAVLYGPQVLAQDEACCRRPFALAEHAELDKHLVPAGPGIAFRILNNQPERHTRHLRPLNSFPAFWPYWVYFDLDAPPLY